MSPPIGRFRIDGMMRAASLPFVRENCAARSRPVRGSERPAGAENIPAIFATAIRSGANRIRHAPQDRPIYFMARGASIAAE